MPPLPGENGPEACDRCDLNLLLICGLYDTVETGAMCR
ncbi:hypothetical protein Mal4_25680 [Maioricimonas rarisocia]|uniref:Uncharacterized protein n=1 Tax=Maioricimonas rarisocia TaxID=2528026 RepID=A0A517Z6Z8_9PLAN|nr:hypothetical protein Mal4_25680 [Maioricimonas rarisocia]